MFTFQVEDDVRELFPDLRIGIMQAVGIDNSGASSELRQIITERAAEVDAKYNPNSLLSNPVIEAWREAYRLFGAKPRESKPTAEALIRRVIHGEEVPRISDAVDAYLATELRFMLPIGGYDLDTIEGAIRLCRSPGGEEFTPLGGGKPEVTRPGEVIYRDDVRVLTRKWNFRDCDACKITETTTNIALFTEGPLASVDSSLVQGSAKDMGELIKRFCGGEIAVSYWDRGEVVPVAEL